MRTQNLQAGVHNRPRRATGLIIRLTISREGEGVKLERYITQICSKPRGTSIKGSMDLERPLPRCLRDLHVAGVLAETATVIIGIMMFAASPIKWTRSGLTRMVYPWPWALHIIVRLAVSISETSSSAPVAQHTSITESQGQQLPHNLFLLFLVFDSEELQNRTTRTCMPERSVTTQVLGQTTIRAPQARCRIEESNVRSRKPLLLHPLSKLQIQTTVLMTGTGRPQDERHFFSEQRSIGCGPRCSSRE